MNIKVFSRTFGPIVLAALILWPSFHQLSGRLFLFIGVVGVLLFRFFINKRLYLTGVKTVHDQVEIRFITSQLIAKRLKFFVHEIQGMDVSEGNYPYKYLGSLRVHAKEGWYTFLIIDKRTYEMAMRVATGNLVASQGRM